MIQWNNNDNIIYIFYTHFPTAHRPGTTSGETRQETTWTQYQPQQHCSRRSSRRSSRTRKVCISYFSHITILGRCAVEVEGGRERERERESARARAKEGRREGGCCCRNKQAPLNCAYFNEMNRCNYSRMVPPGRATCKHVTGFVWFMMITWMS